MHARIPGLIVVATLSALLWTWPASASEPPAPSETISADEMPDYDPWKAFNERTFWFNYYVLDKRIVKPAARVWDRILPDRVQHGISNFFDNISMPPRLINKLLQARPRAAGQEVARFLFNSTFGVAGFIDVGSRMGIHGSKADGGQTLGVWGFGPGPYLVVPFFPPLTLRDGIGYGADTTMDPVGYFVSVPFTISLATTAVRRVNERSLQPAAFDDLEETVIDLYSAIRNLHLQRCRRAVQRGRDDSILFGPRPSVPPPS